MIIQKRYPSIQLMVTYLPHQNLSSQPRSRQQQSVRIQNIGGDNVNQSLMSHRLELFLFIFISKSETKGLPLHPIHQCLSATSGYIDAGGGGFWQTGSYTRSCPERPRVCWGWLLREFKCICRFVVRRFAVTEDYHLMIHRNKVKYFSWQY